VTATPASHAIAIELSEPAPAALAVGSAFAVKVKLRCAEACDLRGLLITVTAPDGTVTTGRIETFDDGVNESGEIALTAPRSVGDHVWTFAIGASTPGAPHEGMLDVAIGVRAQTSSLAVWAIPSPVIAGQPFEIAAGAKSESGCALTGTQIEVCDQDGAVLGCGRLGDAPWPGTSALYWTPVALTAPAAPGLLTWSVRYAANDAELPHEGSSAVFSVVVAPAPEHRLTVKVTAQDAPIENAQVRLGPFCAVTDASGCAQLHLPSGSHDLVVWKAGYEAPVRNVEMTGDTAVDVDMVKLSEDDPDAIWQM
jgi:hypothetical protein